MLLLLLGIFSRQGRQKLLGHRFGSFLFPFPGPSCDSITDEEKVDARHDNDDSI